jgi:hypothetical protein
MENAMNEALIHLIYCSAASRPMSTAALAGILTHARAYNGAHGLTGMLLYAEGSFFQVLEGTAEEIDTLFARIGRDPRHRRITRIIREPIRARTFSDWSMGFADIPASVLDGMAGVRSSCSMHSATAVGARR